MSDDKNMNNDEIKRQLMELMSRMTELQGAGSDSDGIRSELAKELDRLGEDLIAKRQAGEASESEDKNESGDEGKMTDTEKETLKRKLMAIARKEIRITTGKPDAPLAATASRVGGKPAVPQDFEWPYFADAAEGKTDPLPLAFMAQINLKDVAKLDEENLLPKTGILSFFYELESMTWGFRATDRGSARVYYFPDEAALTVAELPDALAEENRIPELAVQFESQISLPGPAEYDEYITDGEDEDYDWDEYEKCRRECGYVDEEWREGEHFKMFGYPDVIQDTMEEKCEGTTAPFLREEGASDDEDAVRERAKDWTLLLQMSTISDGEDYEFMFGDVGNIYFWIRKEDLRDLKFENIWLILQCY